MTRVSVPVRFVNDDNREVGKTEVPALRPLSRSLDAQNSPLLFGCRTGICGTCVVEVLDGAETLKPPDDDEREILSVYAGDLPNARLACQIEVATPMTLRAHCVKRWSGP